MNAPQRFPREADLLLQIGNRFSVPDPDRKRAQYRTIWISDIHLGTKGCNTEMLNDFLGHGD